MRIIKRKDEMKVLERVMRILDIIESIPKDALGNSSERIEKMSKLYCDAAEIAYITAGVEGLNLCIEFFNNRARTMDEIMAVSKAHLRTIANHTKKENKKK